MTILKRADEGAIAVLTLNDPKQLNVLSEDMLSTLTKTLEEIGNNRDIRVVVIEAEGRAFCAGHHLGEMQAARENADGGKAYFADLFDRCSFMMQSIVTLPQPVIAKVQGVATAAGCQLVASCDLALASNTACFGVNGINIGLFCSTPMVALTRNVAKKHAFEMLTSGNFISADRACEIGLINRTTEPDALTSATMELAQTLASKEMRALKIGKEAFYKQAEMPLKEAYQYARDIMVENMLYQETNAAISNFMKKD